MAQDRIEIRGAREHNLKNINVDIPKNKLVVITGLSGSGKSSLAFDTLYAEGQRRYVESLSSYARQFLELMQKPDVDSIEGLSPAISIEQKTTSKNPRSTVGTVTELYDYFRLLYARVGTAYSPATGLPIEAQTVSQMVDRICDIKEGEKLLLLAPIVRDRKGEYKKELQDLKKRGFQRAKVDGELYLIDEVPELKKNIKHTISAVIDRLIIPSINDLDAFKIRLADSLETALSLTDGLIEIEQLSSNEIITFSSKFSCPVSGFTLTEIEPRLFSFNSPMGACPKCDGLGKEIVFDENLVVPDETLSLKDGAIAPWHKDNTRFDQAHNQYYSSILSSLAAHFNESMSTLYKNLSDKFKKVLMYGSEEDIITTLSEGSQSRKVSKPFEGLIPNLMRRFRSTESNWMREHLSRYQSEHKCSACQGKRLNTAALCVKISNLDIASVCEMSIGDLQKWFDTIVFSERQQKIAERILKEITSRIKFLVNVGLDYLSLSRSSGTLSGGESQRIRLASQIGSGLTGVLYVLDEPSIGLHQRDNDRLLETLKHLRDLGNSVVVVEHDEDAIRTADYLIDMGPGAGRHGGEIIAQGLPSDVMKNEQSVTAQYLTGKRYIPISTTRRTGNGLFITLKGAACNNLKNLTVKFPLGKFVAVTGVSGGGKSSLVIETLYKALSRTLNKSKEVPGPHTALEGTQHIDKIIDIDQSPIGRTPRSNPATYIGCFTPIREWFAGLPEAKARGYAPGRFSFNVKGGRCEACQGDGMVKIEMHFLPDIYVQCDQCAGKRYNRETLNITYKNKSIADILDMTVDDAVEFFEAHHQVKDKLKTLQEVGLGYIHVGQQATTLSGGEAQRVKLAKELSKRSTGKTLYILDEPTTGLHFEDIRKLLEVLHRLVDQGNTVIVIEHNLEVIKTADYIIDIGPNGGEKGGEIVAVGAPEDIAYVPGSFTGYYLKPYLFKKAC
jgi:excinuclease ABC subunit A